MAFRGRGRGRGFGGSDYKFAKQEPFVLYPDIELPDRNNVPEEKELAVHNHRLRNFYRTSPYNLGETASEEDTVDIERYSDKAKAKLTDYIKLEHGYFPEELLEGTSRTTCKEKKVQWNPERDLEKLDFLEDLEKLQSNEDKKGKKEKEGEDDEQEDEDVEEEDEQIAQEKKEKKLRRLAKEKLRKKGYIKMLNREAGANGDAVYATSDEAEDSSSVSSG
ncbi:hypothetical protein BVRB_4g073570 [Beta vulgaris subsp. vulgaris]|nr:hypothetical protein BVRB_4g073570 [Beta vulgaris subsp. vulgaris]